MHNQTEHLRFVYYIYYLIIKILIAQLQSNIHVLLMYYKGIIPAVTYHTCDKYQGDHNSFDFMSV